MPDELTQQIARISTGIKAAAQKQKAMSEELLSLRNENTELQSRRQELEEQVQLLEEQVYILKSSVAPLDDESKKDFGKRIDEYLRTINKCIALLKT